MPLEITIKDLLCQTAWEDVAVSLIRLYPDQEENLPGYSLVFEQVCSCDPLPNSQKMMVRICKGEEGYDVTGYIPDDDQGYALDFSLFPEWAGFFVAQEILAEMAAAEAVAHILWEMTFCGYSDDAILARRKELEESIEELRRHPERAIPLEEVLKEIGEPE